VVNFAPLLTLREVPFNDLVKDILTLCKERLKAQVEIEFALTLDRSRQANLGFLQVRPMVVSSQIVEIGPDELGGSYLLIATDRVMGNGVIDSIRDVVYVKPDSFEARYTEQIARELQQINTGLVNDNRPCLLIGFGRWGSSDPWLGIPVNWDQISSAKVIVEATQPSMNVEPSQGSHFFHNMTSFQVCYLSVHHDHQPGINWDWFHQRKAAGETEHVRHIRIEKPLRIKVDGRNGRAGIWYS
jgi:hypothetical protein